MNTVTSYVGVGSNLGNAERNVKAALDALGKLPSTQLHSYSSFFKSAPVDALGDDFINAVARLDTSLHAESLLTELQKIELDFGRERPYQNAPRTLDLDILLYGDVQIATHTLVVPHPRMTSRAFVLMPLLELDAKIYIPGQGLASQFLQETRSQVIRPLS